MSIKKSSLEQKLYYRIAKVIFIILPFPVVIIYALLNHINIHNILEQDLFLFVYAAMGILAYYLIGKGMWRLFLYIVFGGLEDDAKKIAVATPQPGNPATQPLPVKPKPSTASQIVSVIVILGIFAIFVPIIMGYIKLPGFDFNSLTSDSDTGTTETHTYGTACTNTDGIAGLYGTSGSCMTCTNSTAVTNPTGTSCSNGIQGVYCCGTGGGGNNNNNGGGGTKCVPTGCGTLWYCAGSYYVNNQKINVPGLCFPNGGRPGDLYSGWSGKCRQCP